MDAVCGLTKCNIEKGVRQIAKSSGYQLLNEIHTESLPAWRATMWSSEHYFDVTKDDEIICYRISIRMLLRIWYSWKVSDFGLVIACKFIRNIRCLPTTWDIWNFWSRTLVNEFILLIFHIRYKCFITTNFLWTCKVRMIY